jgi:hypothetical protein
MRAIGEREGPWGRYDQCSAGEQKQVKTQSEMKSRLKDRIQETERGRKKRYSTVHENDKCR